MIADDDYILSEGDDEIDEIISAFDISEKDAEDYQIFTEQILAKNENPQVRFILKKNW